MARGRDRSGQRPPSRSPLGFLEVHNLFFLEEFAILPEAFADYRAVLVFDPFAAKRPQEKVSYADFLSIWIEKAAERVEEAARYLTLLIVKYLIVLGRLWRKLVESRIEVGVVPYRLGIALEVWLDVPHLDEVVVVLVCLHELRLRLQIPQFSPLVFVQRALDEDPEVDERGHAVAPVDDDVLEFEEAANPLICAFDILPEALHAFSETILLRNGLI